LPEKLNAKRKLFSLYQSAFSKVDGVKLISEPVNCTSNYWLQTLLLDVEVSELREDVLKITNEGGQMTRPAWTLMHELLPFRNCPRMNLEIAESLAHRLINIPSSPQLAL
jgi:dTDP-4-amino-4,6-dideoxygalactose transaminase